MKLALGSDHRGGKVAYRLVRDFFLRGHYSASEDVVSLPDDNQIVGPYFIDLDLKKIWPLEYGRPYDAHIEDASNSAATFAIDEAKRCLDYPDVAAAVAKVVSTGAADRGILICGTGVGMGIMANKFRNIRAAVCYSEVAAELSRLHNDANVLCISGEFLSVSAIESLVRLWLDTEYEGGRHIPRLAKIVEIEKKTGFDAPLIKLRSRSIENPPQFGKGSF